MAKIHCEHCILPISIAIFQLVHFCLKPSGVLGGKGGGVQAWSLMTVLKASITKELAKILLVLAYFQWNISQFGMQKLSENYL